MRYYLGSCDMKWTHRLHMEDLWIQRELGDSLYSEINQPYCKQIVVRKGSPTLPDDIYKRCDVYVDIDDPHRATLFSIQYPQAISVDDEMKTVWIFGDSFADAQYSNIDSGPPDANSWCNRLAQTHFVENHALCGTGSDYSLDLFLKKLDRNRLNAHNTSVIFVASDSHRLNLTNNFYKSPNEQVTLKHIAAKKIRHHGNLFAKNLFKYLVTEQWCNTDSVKTFATINSLAGALERVAFVHIGNMYPLYNDLFTVHPNLTLLNTSLIEASRAEPENTDSVLDPRPNHFSPRCHDYLYSAFDNWIHGDPLSLDDLPVIAANA